MAVLLRPARPADAEVCGRILYAAFRDVDERHGFTPGFESAAHGTEIAALFIDLEAIHGIVAVDGSQIVGVVFLDRGDPIKSIGLIAVDPAAQLKAVGRRLMEAAIAEAGDARGIRLVQVAFNTHAMGLYASLGFEVKEPLVVMKGRPRDEAPATTVSRTLTPADLEECAALCRRIHGIDRNVDLMDAMKFWPPTAIVRDGRIVAYTYAFRPGSLSWGVAETADDLETLLLALAGTTTAPLRFNVPSRDTRLMRWCLDQGLRIERPLTLMARGWYQEPRGPYLPSGFY